MDEKERYLININLADLQFMGIQNTGSLKIHDKVATKLETIGFKKAKNGGSTMIQEIQTNDSKLLEEIVTNARSIIAGGYSSLNKSSNKFILPSKLVTVKSLPRLRKHY